MVYTIMIDFRVRRRRFAMRDVASMRATLSDERLHPIRRGTGAKQSISTQIRLVVRRNLLYNVLPAGKQEAP